MCVKFNSVCTLQDLAQVTCMGFLIRHGKREWPRKKLRYVGDLDICKNKDKNLPYKTLFVYHRGLFPGHKTFPSYICNLPTTMWRECYKVNTTIKLKLLETSFRVYLILLISKNWVRSLSKSVTGTVFV